MNVQCTLVNLKDKSGHQEAVDGQTQAPNEGCGKINTTFHFRNPTIARHFISMTSTAPASDPTILASKRAVYVGGLAESVTPQLLRAAMIPFGPIKSLDMVSFELWSLE